MDEFTALVLEIFRINGLLLAAGNRLAGPERLTSARWQVLGAVTLAARPLTVAEIGRAMGLTRQGVQRIVDELEALGLVRRTAHPESLRARPVALTKAGEAAYARVSARQGPWAARMSKTLTPRQLATARRVLLNLRRQLEGDEAEPEGDRAGRRDGAKAGTARQARTARKQVSS